MDGRLGKALQQELYYRCCMYAVVLKIPCLGWRNYQWCPSLMGVIAAAAQQFRGEHFLRTVIPPVDGGSTRCWLLRCASSAHCCGKSRACCVQGPNGLHRRCTYGKQRAFEWGRFVQLLSDLGVCSDFLCWTKLCCGSILCKIILCTWRRSDVKPVKTGS